MDENDVRRLLEAALHTLAARDEHLLVNDLSERCIAARLAMHLQPLFAAHDDSLSVDVEYNRVDDVVKAVALPDDCSRWRNREGQTRVVPDVIVHRRGGAGPNILVIELKKTSNPAQLGCDRIRVAAFRAQLGYSFGALVECETQNGAEPGVRLAEWIGARH
jgi:hypothetical protein